MPQISAIYLVYAGAAIAGIMIAEAVFLLFAGRSDRRAAINRRMKLQENKITQEQVLLQLRKDFAAGRARLRIEDGVFRLADYRRFLADNAASIGAFKARQQAAFEAERERWKAAGQAEYISEADIAAAAADSELDLPEGAQLVASYVPGNIWKLLVEPGQHVKAGDPLAVVESMKMEFTVTAPADGEVLQLLCREASPVAAGQDLLILRAATH